MRWIEGVEYEGNRLVTKHVDQEGHRHRGSLTSLRSTLPPRGYEVADGSGISLASLEPVDDQVYLDAIGMAHSERGGHQIFGLQAAGRQMLIPAGALLLALVGTPSVVGGALMRPASLNYLALPPVDGERCSLQLAVPPSIADQLGTSIGSRMTWLTCFPSARQFWDSVYLNGARGILSLQPPKASVEARFFGRSHGGVVIVSRMFVRSLAPLEDAFSFARHCVPRLFEFTDERGSSSAIQLAAYRSTAGLPELKRQGDIPEGELGWAMSEDEWIAVRERMLGLGFQCRADALGGLNLALEKHGSGQTWTSAAVLKGSSSIYSRWLRSGKWDALKKVLRETRAP